MDRMEWIELNLPISITVCYPPLAVHALEFKGVDLITSRVVMQPLVPNIDCWNWSFQLRKNWNGKFQQAHISRKECVFSILNKSKKLVSFLSIPNCFQLLGLHEVLFHMAKECSMLYQNQVSYVLYLKIRLSKIRN